MNTTVLNITLASNISAPSETSDSQFSSDSTQFSDELQRAKSQANNQSADSTSNNTTDSNAPTQKKHRSTKVDEKAKPVPPATPKSLNDASKNSQPSAIKQNAGDRTDSATTVNAQIALGAQSSKTDPNQSADNSLPITDSEADPKSAGSVNSTNLPLPQKLTAKLLPGAKATKPLNSQSGPTQQTADEALQANEGNPGGVNAKGPDVSPFKATSSSTTAPAANVSDVSTSQSTTHTETKSIPTVSNLDAQFPAIFAALSSQAPNTNHAAPATLIAPPTPNVDSTFSAANHANIVTTVRTQLLPDGGTMQIRLDPPDLGTMHISVTVDSGVVSASFQTSNDQATQLVTHSLSQLKAALETQGVTVDKLHVQQTSRSENSSNDSSSGDRNSSRQQGSLGDSTNQQEQQRRELLRRMWQRVAGNKDELDMVA